jgi:CRISPR/Cas system CMR-associated protein Cmr5 small subunit
MSFRRVDQGLAEAAARLLPRPGDREDRVERELRTRYRQLRIMLHGAGLAATYAFIMAKANAESGALADAYGKAAAGIRGRLVELGLISADPAMAGPRDVLAQLASLDAVGYARATAEAAALAGWLSRLADAIYQPTGSDAVATSRERAR